MTMQLSERAKQLIPKARIVSFATWKNLYSDEVIAIFQEADNQSRYLTDEDLERIKNLEPNLSLMLEKPDYCESKLLILLLMRGKRY